MPINVIDIVKPKNNGAFPVVEDIDLKGGYSVVADITARDAIHAANRKNGMLVFMETTGEFWQLQGGIDNANWTLAQLGGLPAGGNQRDFLRLSSNPFVRATSIKWDGTHLWVGNQGVDTVVRIDPSTVPPTVVANIPVPQVKDAHGNDQGVTVAGVDSTHVYVFGYGGNLTLINKTTYALNGVVLPSLSLSGNPTTSTLYLITAAWVSGDNIFVATGPQAMDTPHGFAGCSGQIDRYSKAAVLAAYPSEGVSAGSLQVAGDPIEFLTFGSGFLFAGNVGNIYKIDPTPMTVSDSYAGWGYHSCVFAFGSLWVTNSDMWTVERFDPAFLSMGATPISMADDPRYITSDATTIWVRSTGDVSGGNLTRISTGFGSEAVVATILDPLADPTGQIACDGTFVWVPVSGAGVRDGILKYSTGSGTEALVSFWQGPATLEYNPAMSSGDIGYAFPKPGPQVLTLREMPVPEGKGAVLGQILQVQVDQQMTASRGLAYDHETHTLWVPDDSGKFFVLSIEPRLNPDNWTAPLVYPPSKTIPAVDPAGNVFFPTKVVLDARHAVSIAGDLIYVIDRATDQVVGLGTVTVGDGIEHVTLKGDHVFVSSGFDKLQRFSKEAMIAAFPTPAPASATLVNADSQRFGELCFGGGSSLFSAVDLYTSVHVYEIDPTGSMSILNTWDSGTNIGRGGLYFAAGSLWLSAVQADSVLRFNPASIATGPTATIVLPRMSPGVITSAWAVSPTPADHIWVACMDGLGATYLVDISTGTGTESYVQRVLVPNANPSYALTGLAWDGRYIWASSTSPGAVARIDVMGDNEGFEDLWTGPFKFKYETPAVLTLGGDLTGTPTAQQVSKIRGVLAPNPAAVAVGKTVDVTNNPIPSFQMPIMPSPRVMVSDVSYLYLGQWGATNSPEIWKLSPSGSSLYSPPTSVDLSIPLGTVYSVHDLAQDATYLYAATWNGSNVAIIEKATMKVVGWGWTGLDTIVTSVLADGAGNFYSYSYGIDPSTYTVITPFIQKFTTASCIGHLPNTVTSTLSSASLMPAIYGNIRLGGGQIWFTDGGDNALTVVNPTTLVVSNTAATVGGESFTDTSFYAFGSIWVAGYTDTPTIWRLNPTTLAVEATFNPFDFPNSIGGMATGPNPTGTPDTVLFASGTEGGTGWIDPATNIYTVAIPYDASYAYGEVAVLNNYIYFAAYDRYTTVGVSYFDAMTRASGLLSPAPTNVYALQYTTPATPPALVEGGDLTGTSPNQTVSKIRGMLTPAVTSAAVGDLLQVQADIFITPTDVLWEPTGAKVWVADSGVSTLFSYDPATEVLTEYPFTAPGISGLSRIIAWGDHLYAIGVRVSGTDPTVLAFSRLTGALVGSGSCTTNYIATGLAVQTSTGHLLVAGRAGLDRFLLSSLITTTGLTPHTTLAIDRAQDVAWDAIGQLIYVSDGINGHLKQINAIGSTVIQTYNGLSGEPTTSAIIVAFGSVWVMDDGALERVDPATMTNVATVAIGSVLGQWYLGADAAYLWAAHSTDSNPHRIDPATNTLTTSAGVTIATDRRGGLSNDGLGRMWNAVSTSAPATCITAYAVDPAAPDELIRYTPKKLVYVAHPGSYSSTGTSVSGVAAHLMLNGGTTELALENQKAYVVTVKVVANRTDAAGRAMFIHDLLVHCTSGAVVIDNDNATLDVLNGEAWTFVVSATGSILRYTFTGTAGQTVNAIATTTWTEVSGY